MRLLRRDAKWLPRAALAAVLVLATAPTWRVLMLGAQPTIEELRQLVCSSRSKPA